MKKKNLCLICKAERSITSWFFPKCSKLVNAAPELLEACKQAKIDLRVMANSRFMNTALRTGAQMSLKKIDKAIAKAESEVGDVIRD